MSEANILFSKQCEFFEKHFGGLPARFVVKMAFCKILIISQWTLKIAVIKGQLSQSFNIYGTTTFLNFSWSIIHVFLFSAVLSKNVLRTDFATGSFT